jgi:hypothetical protein
MSIRPARRASPLIVLDATGTQITALASELHYAATLDMPKVEKVEVGPRMPETHLRPNTHAHIQHRHHIHAHERTHTRA